MTDHLISRSRFLDALVLDADNKTDLIQVHQALEKAVISPEEVRGVVRCEDCALRGTGTSRAYGGYWCNETTSFVRPDDFCSRGKKMAA